MTRPCQLQVTREGGQAGDGAWAAAEKFCDTCVLAKHYLFFSLEYAGELRTIVLRGNKRR
jgi:hypothetical protein